METVIEIKDVWKRYAIGPEARKYQSLRDLLSFRRRKKDHIWALSGIDLEIKEGERIGIIGNNGAGKTTLLKLIARITYPTKGMIRLRGRVASLLEVGTGFHPELTGRENIYFNGAILGMKHAEIKARFDEIVAFSGVERFIETPLKQYSSGMQMRLAFSVAAHLQSEILLIDEVLSVGDAEFQKKCIARMQEISREKGKTLLFVSHNMQSVIDLTDKCVFLERGKITAEGPTTDVISQYLAQRTELLEYNAEKTENDQPFIVKVRLHTSLKNNIQEHGKQMQVEIEIETDRPIAQAAVSYQILNALHQPVIQHLNLSSEIPFCTKRGKTILRSTIPSVSLYPGNYSLRVHFADAASRMKFETLDAICPFRVELSSGLREYYWDPGSAIVTEENYWEVKEISEP
jgi:lipopolysaccharide transport system ATP-binding protein